MSVQEFSDQFDILMSSYTRFKDFDKKEEFDSLDFNEYEKSIYLTKAQEELVKELYTGNLSGEAFEITEQRRRELEYLVVQKQYTQEDKLPIILLPDAKYNHVTFALPEDLMYIIYEQVSWDTDEECLGKLLADVVPVTHDEFWRVRNNPFRGPNSKRVLRLDNKDMQVELVSNGEIGIYVIRYLRKPDPIILANLPNESIDGVSTPQTCKLSESLHKDILERAVRLALDSKRIYLGKKSE